MFPISSKIINHQLNLDEQIHQREEEKDQDCRGQGQDQRKVIHIGKILDLNRAQEEDLIIKEVDQDQEKEDHIVIKEVDQDLQIVAKEGDLDQVPRTANVKLQLRILYFKHDKLRFSVSPNQRPADFYYV